MANEKKIYQGTELKFQLDIESVGFSMINDDFKVVVKNKNTQQSVVILKSDMIITQEEKFLFTIDTSVLGIGTYIITTTAYVPDEDFKDGYRTEVQKQTLCQVTD